MGYKFRRQHIIDHFIVDFYASEARLVIEIDGEVHKYTEAYDAQRQAYLENIGLTVIRFTNGDILHRLEGVLYQIDDFLTEHIEED